MPYFSQKNRYRTNYSGYAGDDNRLPDAMLTVEHDSGDTTMTVGAGKWLSGDQFYKNLSYINSEHGVPNDIEHLQNTNYLKYDNGVPFSESGLTYHHKDGVFRSADEDDQLQLFAHNPPGPSRVEYLVSRDNPGAKITAMTLLGMADMDSRANTGHPLQTSDDLSPHSLRIARHLRDRGVVPSDDVPHSNSNDMSFGDAEASLADYGDDLEDIKDPSSGYTDVSDRARLARKHIRSMLRPTKATPKPRGPKPQQLKLFED